MEPTMKAKKRAADRFLISVDDILSSSSSDDDGQADVTSVGSPHGSVQGGEVQANAKRQSLKQRCQRFYDDVFGAWLNGLRCQQVLRSKHSIRKERQRQRNYNRYIIHPFSLFRLIWIMCMTLTITVTLVSLPVDLAFFTSPEDSVNRTNDSYVMILRDVYPAWHVIMIVMDVVYGFDMFLTFRTGYVDPNTDKVKLSSSHIARNYATSWFIVDLIAVFPYDEVYEHFRTPSARSIPLGIRVCRFLKILSILRLVRLVSYVHEIEMNYSLPATYTRMGNFFALYLLMTHWNGCIQYMVAYLTWYPNFPDNIWIMVDDLKNKSLLYKYTRGLFRAVSHEYAVSYGAQPPQRIGETWVVNLSMLFGCIMFGIFLATVVQVIASMDSAGKKYDEVMSELRQYLRFHHVSHKLQKRCLMFFEQKYQHAFYDEYKFLHSNLLSPPRREEIARSNCRDLLERIDLFKEASAAFVTDMLSKLEFQVYFRGDFLFKAGQPLTSLCFITNGLIHFRKPLTEEITKSLSEGEYFGASALFSDEKLDTDVIAADLCDIYSLSFKDCSDLAEIYPEFKVKLKAIARK